MPGKPGEPDIKMASRVVGMIGSIIAGATQCPEFDRHVQKELEKNKISKAIVAHWFANGVPIQENCKTAFYKTAEQSYKRYLSEGMKPNWNFSYEQSFGTAGLDSQDKLQQGKDDEILTEEELSRNFDQYFENCTVGGYSSIVYSMFLAMHFTKESVSSKFHGGKADLWEHCQPCVNNRGITMDELCDNPQRNVLDYVMDRTAVITENQSPHLMFYSLSQCLEDERSEGTKQTPMWELDSEASKSFSVDDNPSPSFFQPSKDALGMMSALMVCYLCTCLFCYLVGNAFSF